MNDGEALVRTRAATMTDLRVVVSWIGTSQECERWAGPGISYPLKPQALEEQIGMRSAVNVAVEDALGDAAPFTFEPHVRSLGGRFGFKREDVYWFDADCKATAL